MPSHEINFYHSLPKVELHRHLEGSLRLDTLLEIARQYDLPIPGREDLRPLVQVVQSDPRTSQNFLSKFETLRNFYRSPEIIRRVTAEAITDAAADNIHYLELRFTPAALSKTANLPIADVMDWVLDGVRATQGVDNISTRLLASVNRHESLELAEQVAQHAVDRLNEGIVGLDLAGDEAHFPAAPFEPIFRAARQSGLKTTIHAGEWGPAANVAEAIDLFMADRIGHGVRVLEDPGVVAAARGSSVPFEVCPTSNFQSGVVSDLSRHPVQKMIDLGLITTINTDDPGISQISLGSEYSLVCEQNGLSLEILKQRVFAASQAAFIPQEEQETLINTIESSWPE